MSEWLDDYKNLNNWNFNSTVASKTIVYQDSVNELVYTGGAAFERFYLPIDTLANTMYRFKFKMHSPSGFTFGGYGKNFDCAFATLDSSIINTDALFSKMLLCTSKRFISDASDVDQEYELRFKGTGGVVYIGIDLGYITDAIQITLVISDMHMETHVISHDYSSVQEIVDTGIGLADILINNVSYDDNAYPITNTPSWIKFNGLQCTSIYASGNSFFGINSTAEHIKLNRRDTKMWYLWTEEGTLYNYYQFYRIYWRGTSPYNSSNWYVWEVIFFSTGDILIHLMSQPSTYDGTCQVVASTTYNYTKPTDDNPYVWFHPTDENNSVFEISYNLIELEVPYDKKYLVESDGVLYTINSDTVEMRNYIPVRFVRCWSNGSSVNEYNHYKEIKVIDTDGNNRASGIVPTTSIPLPTNLECITDGVVSTGTSYATVGTRTQWVQIDLGAIFNIANIQVWRYYDDKRTYYDNKIQISTDGARFTDVWNKDITESASGQSVELSQEVHTGGELVPLETTELVANTFREYGVDFIPQSNLLVTLHNPRVYYWIDTTEYEIKIPHATQSATPFGNRVFESADYYMTDESILGIEGAIVEASESTLFAVSFDSGETWKMYADGAWATLSQHDTGMSAQMLHDIPPEAWALVATTGKFRFRVVLMDDTSTFTKLIIDYLNE